MSKSSSSSNQSAKEYSPPTHGILSLFPASWVPYAELTRLHKPTGILVIYLPYLFGLLFISIAVGPVDIPPSSVVYLAFILLIASFVLRSAGCTWNDVVDYKMDRETERCRLRPVARSAVSPVSGVVFFSVQICVWLAILWSVSSASVLLAIPGLWLVLIYPYAKRVTEYPQVVLGVTLAWGILVGVVVVPEGADFVIARGTAEKEPWLALGMASLFVAYIAWTIIFDTIYGFQDLQDDLKSGVKSICVRWQHHAKALLLLMALLQVSSLVALGLSLGVGNDFYLAACGGSAIGLCCMIWKVNLKRPAECAWWFQYGTVAVGSCMLWGLMASYVGKTMALRS